MRRMITNKQVVDIVNKGIEEGEIEASGLTPEQKEKLNNALTLPKEAPTEQQLVGINTSGKQNTLNIGDGLAVVNGELQTDGVKILVVDANNNGSVEITEDQYTKLQNRIYDFLVIKNSGVPASFHSGTYIFTYQQCLDSSSKYYYTMQYMTSASIMINEQLTPFNIKQYLAALVKDGTVYKIAIVGCGGSIGTHTSLEVACNGKLSDNWTYTVYGDNPMEALTNGRLIKFRYVDSTDEHDHNAPIYEAIPVFYTYATNWNDEPTPAGRVTFYSAPGVIFKDFYISFTRNDEGHIKKWNLTEITQ